MDVLPMCSIFQELQIVHDTGYFSALPSLEEYWQQVNIRSFLRSGTETRCFYFIDYTAKLVTRIITFVNTVHILSPDAIFHDRFPYEVF